jgi:hypothetical protein
VVVDGVLSDEKLSELLTGRTEYHNLDFKRECDISSTRDKVELAKDIGAMGVAGAYILIGVNDDGSLSGTLDGVDTRAFDEASLRQKLSRYLPDPIQISSRVAEVEGHTVLAICVSPNRVGCTIFKADGTYEDDGRPSTVFRQGEIFWRDGTQSVRISQAGLEAVIDRRVAVQKEAWLEEQRQIRAEERAEYETASRSRQRTEGPLGTVDLDLDPKDLNAAALEFLRSDDDIGFRHLLNDTKRRGAAAIGTEDLDGLNDVLDKLACLAATLLEYEQEEAFARVIEVFVSIYAMPFGEGDARRFGYSSQIAHTEWSPQVWLAVIEHIFGLGALAARLEDWSAVRTLALQLPQPLVEDGYEHNWMRHALTMATRANHLQKEGEDGRPVSVSLLSLARLVIQRLACLRLDLDGPDDDRLLTGLAQYDFLSNVAALGDAGSLGPQVFYPNFARVRQERIQPLADRLLTDQALRATLFSGSDEDLALALQELGARAQEEGWRFDGFMGWPHTPVQEFIDANLPSS